jgi:hypothetical protein
MSDAKTNELMFELGKLDAQTTPLDKEPVRRIGTATTTGVGVLTLLLYMFPELPEKYKVILIILTVMVPIIGASFTRKAVWSPDSVITVVNEAASRAVDEIKKSVPRRYNIEPRDRTPLEPDA